MPPNGEAFIYDGDPGIDDALAILFALKSLGRGLRAITCVAGNVPVTKAFWNAAKLIELSKLDGLSHEPELGIGSAKPLRGALRTSEHIHGSDGLGETQDLFSDMDLGPYSAKARDGVDLLTEILIRERGTVKVVAAGPLTNIAKLITRHPSAAARIEELVIMGGVFEGDGNASPVAEYNVYSDPCAARVVFGSGIPIRLLPLEVTGRAVVRPGDLGALGGSKASEFALRALKYYMKAQERHLGREEGYLHDPLAMAAAIDGSLVLKEELWRVDVEVKGEITSGQTVAYRGPWALEGNRIRVVREVDVERFFRAFFKAFGKDSSARASP
ncbi:MAG: nucleoside hydrolase [Candidatus Bathyarchaeia archaeon]